MKSMIHIISRELVERKLIFAGALMVGMLTLATPLLPSLRSQSPIETITGTAGILALAWAIGAAAMSGTSVLARDLAERRLSFYFSKPVSHWSIWGGKMAAGILLTILSAFLVVLPATLIGGGIVMLFTSTAWRLEEFVWMFPLMCILAMGIAHILSVALRSRSKWVALDVFGIMAVAHVSTWAIRPIVAARANRLLDVMAGSLLAALFAAVFISGAIGIARGRVDIRLVHRATSIALISILGTAAMLLAGYSLWVRSATPDDLSEAHVVQIARSGGWFAVEGPTRGRGDYKPAFLMSSGSGAWFRIPSQRYYGTIDFSEDGSKAVWGEIVSRSPLRMALLVADLTGPEPVPVRMLVTIDPSTAAGPVLSPDGSRMAVVNDGVLSVYDTREKRSIATVKWPAVAHEWIGVLAFHGNERLRIHSRISHPAPALNDRPPERTRMFELDLATRKLAPLGEIEARWAIPNPSGDRTIAMLDTATRERAILDGRTGATIAAIGSALQVRWLSDGRIAALQEGGPSLRVAVYSRDGAMERAIDLPSAPYALLGDEVAPGKVVVATSQPPESRRQFETSVLHLVDLTTGQTRKVAERLIPGYGPSANLYAGEGMALIYFDPLTGERRTLID